MKSILKLYKVALSLTAFVALTSASNNNESPEEGVSAHAMKMALWSRGAYDLDLSTDELEEQIALAPFRFGPIRKGRVDGRYSTRSKTAFRSKECLEFECNRWGEMAAQKIRGGASTATTATTYAERLEAKLSDLSEIYGSGFAEAIQLNKEEHAADCDKSCENFYCAGETVSGEKVDGKVWNENNATTFKAYTFGGVPPEDFAEEFGFPLDLIKVTEGKPLFSAEEAAQVVETAELEGVAHNEYQSGKYKLGGDWLVNLPQTRAWFNERLANILFPLLYRLFPEIVSSPSVLRAHSVSLLKYNSSHPRTDVHIDNGILAMTLAMTPSSDYSGGGTFFEHFGVGNVLPMDVGHGTFRPGSVRHGGHKVTRGTRYILGAFLLIEDRVEHVRRLKNRGTDLRKAGDLEGAAKHFEWALGINPKCTTCLKDWSEILLTQKNFVEAEKKTRKALDLLDNLDSDALFSLGVILSEQGKDDESVQAYTRSLELNAEDADLCYNLGVKLGSKGDQKGEMAMYARATAINPSMGGAWINWGIALAESGNLDDSELMFLKALECEWDIRPKAQINLALVHQERANQYARAGDISNLKTATDEAGRILDQAKPLLDNLAQQKPEDEDIQHYLRQFKPLRISVHRLAGHVLVQSKDLPGCEEEFRRMSESFPDVPGVWDMLARILDFQGKTDEAAKCKAKMAQLQA